MGIYGSFCRKVGGRENPAIAAWGVSTAILSCISILLFLLCESQQLKDNYLLNNSLNSNEYGEIMFVNRKTFICLGIIFSLLFIFSLLITILGYFISSFFLIFSCPLILINQLICIITASFGGYMLQCLYSYKEGVLDQLRYNTSISALTAAGAAGTDTAAAAAAAGIKTADFSHAFVDAHASLLLLLCILCLSCLVPLTNAGIIDNKGTMIDIMIYIPILMGCIGTFCIFILPNKERIYIILGSIYLLICIINSICIYIQKNTNNIYIKIITLLLCIIYLFLCIFSCICLFIISKHYIQGRNILINYIRTDNKYKYIFINKIQEKDYFLYKLFIINNNGLFSLAAAAAVSLLFIYSLVAAVFSLRALIGGNDALRRELSSDSSSNHNDKP